MIVVMMGVSGSGKSSVGAALAERMGWPFEEGDDLHPPENRAKMSAGIPLTDEDRGPWLDRIADWMRGRFGAGGVVSCSALKRAYRDRLRDADPDVRFVLVDPGREELRRRLAARQGHFMPPSLLDSQIATLERPTPDERVLVLDDPHQGIAQDVEAIRAWLDSQ
jgi:gluconokinase